MDARLWHQQATTPRQALPAPVPVDVFDAWSQNPQNAYWAQLQPALAGVVWTVPALVDTVISCR